MYEAITNAEVVPDMGLTSELGQKIKDNFDYLYSQIGSGANGSVPNADFEIDSDDDGLPDMWNISTYSGGWAGLDIMAPASGSKCLKFIHPGGTGNGGGYADSDFIPFVRSAIVSFWTKATAACKNRVEIRYYDKDQAYLETYVLDTRTDTPNSWTPVIGHIGTLNNNACYIKIRLIGGYTDTAVAASIYFDAISVGQAAPFFTVPFSFSEYTFTSGSYTDQQTVDCTIPLVASGNATGSWRVNCRMDAKGQSGATNVYVRLKISTHYGAGEQITADGNYYSINPKLLLFSNGAFAGQQTLVVQAYRVTAGYTGYIRKPSAFLEIEYLAGEGV